MKLVAKNKHIWFIVFLVLIVILFLATKEKRPWTKGPILSKTDYRIFACGKEIFLEQDQQLLNKKPYFNISLSSKGGSSKNPYADINAHSIMNDSNALDRLVDGIEQGNMYALIKYFELRYGKPKKRKIR